MTSVTKSCTAAKPQIGVPEMVQRLAAQLVGSLPCRCYSRSRAAIGELQSLILDLHKAGDREGIRLLADAIIDYGSSLDVLGVPLGYLDSGAQFDRWFRRYNHQALKERILRALLRRRRALRIDDRTLSFIEFWIGCSRADFQAAIEALDAEYEIEVVQIRRDLGIQLNGDLHPDTVYDLTHQLLFDRKIAGRWHTVVGQYRRPDDIPRLDELIAGDMTQYVETAGEVVLDNRLYQMFDIWTDYGSSLVRGVVTGLIEGGKLRLTQVLGNLGVKA